MSFLVSCSFLWRWGLLLAWSWPIRGPSVCLSSTGIQVCIIPSRPAFLCRFWGLNCKASTLPFEPCPNPIYLLVYELCLSSVFGSDSKRAGEVAPPRDRGAEI